MKRLSVIICISLLSVQLAMPQTTWARPLSAEGERQLETIKRVSLETGGGILIGLGGSILALGVLLSSSSSAEETIGKGVLFGPPIYFTMVASGIYAGGAARDGRGDFSSTILGSLIGGGSGALFSILIGADAGPVAFFTAASSLIGGMVGYERSHRRNVAAERSPRASAPILNYEAETDRVILGWSGQF